MSKLNAILDAGAGRQQLTVDELLAVIEVEEHDSGCEVERECYEKRGIQAWQEKRGVLVQVYQCGFIGAGTVKHCPKRRLLLQR